jgi:hypothetical protein
MRAEASRNGYSGPTSMSFLRLTDIELTIPCQRVEGLSALRGGLNVASDANFVALVRSLRASHIEEGTVSVRG